MTDDLILAYRLALGALVLLTMLQGTGPMRRTIFTLLGLYLIQIGFAQLLWPSANWSAVMILLDFAAGMLITLHPAGRIQALIGLTFIPQIGFHLGRIFNGTDADMWVYWWGLSILGFLQLAMVGGWWVNDRVRRYRGLRFSHPPAIRTDHQSMDR